MWGLRQVTELMGFLLVGAVSVLTIAQIASFFWMYTRTPAAALHRAVTRACDAAMAAEKRCEQLESGIAVARAEFGAIAEAVEDNLAVVEKKRRRIQTMEQRENEGAKQKGAAQTRDELVTGYRQQVYQ